MIVLDTDVVSELLRPVPAPQVLSWLSQHAQVRLTTTAVTVAEVRDGLALLPTGCRQDALLEAADALFRGFRGDILPFDAHAALQYADVVARRERAGNPITGFDAQIAAICRSSGAELATAITATSPAFGSTSSTRGQSLRGQSLIRRRPGPVSRRSRTPRAGRPGTSTGPRAGAFRPAPSESVALRQARACHDRHSCPCRSHAQPRATAPPAG